MTNLAAPSDPASIARAAALLDAIARDSEAAVDFEVPIRCGQAANRLYALLGTVGSTIPQVGDDATAISVALTEAARLLSSISAGEVPQPVLDALVQVRAAQDAIDSSRAR